MIVVSGCPRSGTSMMMRVMKSVFGEGRILSSPMEPAPEQELSEIQEYIRKRQLSKRTNTKQQERAKDMNPNGYHEMEFTTRGIHYLPKYESLLEEDLHCPEKKIVKVVSQGLAISDPRHVHKIIYMVRDPRCVAKSQERLGRNNPMSPEMAPAVNGKKALIRSVSMFLNVSIQAAHWILVHKDIPVLVVEYEKLLGDVENTLEGIQNFLGEGDFSSAAGLIDGTLNRSKPLQDSGEDWEAADKIYTKLQQSDWQGVMDIVEEERKKPRTPKEWYCVRIEEMVNAHMCELCQTHAITRNNFKERAHNKKVPWFSQPCVAECLLDGISVEDSIKNNKWVDDEE